MQDALFRFLLFFTRDEADTRNILQELYRRIAAKPRLCSGVKDARGFLLRLSRNLAIDFMRRSDSRRRAVARSSAEMAGLFAEAWQARRDPFLKRRESYERRGEDLQEFRNWKWRR